MTKWLVVSGLILLGFSACDGTFSLALNGAGDTVPSEFRAGEIDASPGTASALEKIGLPIEYPALSQVREASSEIGGEVVIREPVIAIASHRPTSQIRIPGLELVMSAPVGTTVQPGFGNTFLVAGEGLSLTIKPPSRFNPVTLDAALEDVSLYGPSNLEEELFDDGWSIAFRTRGRLGENHVLHVRRTVSDRDVWCETTSPTRGGLEAALTACLSLAPEEAEVAIQ